MENYYLGIDVGKFEHQATLINEQKEMIGQSIRFGNNQNSFGSLINQIKKGIPQDSNIQVGMESTGHYWFNLNDFFKSAGIKNVQIIMYPQIQTAILVACARLKV